MMYKEVLYTFYRQTAAYQLCLVALDMPDPHKLATRPAANFMNGISRGTKKPCHILRCKITRSLVASLMKMLSSRCDNKI